MSFLRQQRTQPGYDPNQRHVLHGLDADLIMLGLALHEPHFFVLREEVLFGRKEREKREADELRKATEAVTGVTDGVLAPADRWVYNKNLQILQISTLREYLRAEFRVCEAVPFRYDFERVVDDFVFMCFFVGTFASRSGGPVCTAPRVIAPAYSCAGNDFLPHLPTLDIRDGAIEFLFNVYKRVLPSLGDYLTRPGGLINLSNVDVILAEVGQIEDEVFQRRKADEDREKDRRQQRNSTRRRQQVSHDASKAQAVALGPGRGPAAAAPRAAACKDEANAGAASALRNSILGHKTTVAAAEPAADAATVHATPASVMPTAAAGDGGPPPASIDAKAILEGRVKAKEQLKLDTYSETINDEIRLGEAGWKDRYYADKYKSEDIAKGGGREKIFQTYVEGLCWVMLYYYSGCASWKWCARCLSMRALRVPHTVATLSPQVLPLPLRPVRE